MVSCTKFANLRFFFGQKSQGKVAEMSVSAIAIGIVGSGTVGFDCCQMTKASAFTVYWYN